MNIWQKINGILEQDKNLYLLTVIESVGSAPGRKGFKMLVTEDHELFGSIGGGIMEYNLVEQAKSYLDNHQSVSQIIEQVHSGRSKSSSGMICSGSQIVAFTPLDLQQWQKHKDKHDHAKVLQLTQDGIEFLSSHHSETTEIQDQNCWKYRELLNQKINLHLFGGGHVSVPTAELLNRVGFEVFLYDNRDHLNTFENNVYVTEKRVVHYENILSQVNFNANDYVVLMTHKFTEDKLLLSQLLGNKLRYLGVLGSKNKIKVMFNALLNEGHLQTSIDKVHAPIGIDINSRTIEEIAISIAAEVIKEKNK